MLCNPIAVIRKLFVIGTIRNINSYERRYHSENGEDGIIDIIFSKIDPGNKICVEFGIAPNEGNTVRLKKCGWQCLWMDVQGDGNLIKKEKITAENINDLLAKYDIPYEFEILSIDIDYNDYWVWKAVKKYSPKVVIIEYNSTIPVTESKTVAYDLDLHASATDSHWGASLAALQKLGESKGYTLVVCDNRGVNAFFIRKDLLKSHFELKPIEVVYRPPRYGVIRGGRYIGYLPSDKEMMEV